MLMMTAKTQQGYRILHQVAEPLVPNNVACIVDHVTAKCVRFETRMCGPMILHVKTGVGAEEMVSSTKILPLSLS